ncbi:hypothetical protein O9929_14270 [Vibrio lentus]|nr:hypothetical protein [Vibrio lentus]
MWAEAKLKASCASNKGVPRSPENQQQAKEQMTRLQAKSINGTEIPTGPKAAL